METKIIPAQYDDAWEKAKYVGLESLTATYVQAPDTNSNSDDIQVLTIETQTACAPSLKEALKEDSFYFNIKTDKWSFSDVNELIDIVKDFKQRIYMSMDKSFIENLLKEEE